MKLSEPICFLGSLNSFLNVIDNEKDTNYEIEKDKFIPP
jgi:hypothetical protein